jgi:hypothetical protein
MRMPSKNSGHLQLDLLWLEVMSDAVATPTSNASGQPLMPPVSSLFADQYNPRTVQVVQPERVAEWVTGSQPITRIAAEAMTVAAAVCLRDRNAHHAAFVRPDWRAQRRP